MNEERRYRESRDTVLVIINDMVELQSGKLTLSDTANGRIHFRTRMYGIWHDFHFMVSDTDDGCLVNIEMNDKHAPDMIYRAFVLLESLMANRPENGTESRRKT